MVTTFRKIMLALWLMAFAVTVSANPPAAFEGRKLYVSYCLLCHGSDGSGDGPLAKSMEISPADLAATVPAINDKLLATIITGGGEPMIADGERHKLLSATMPEWNNVFDRPQVEALIAYLRFLSRKKHDLMGDPEAGSNLYQKYCQVCHGEEGRGDGIMTSLIGVKPMDHTDPDETDRLDNRALMTGILDGKGRFMPAWRGILSQSDVEALVSYIRLLAD